VATTTTPGADTRLLVEERMPLSMDDQQRRHAQGSKVLHGSGPKLLNPSGGLDSVSCRVKMQSRYDDWHSCSWLTHRRSNVTIDLLLQRFQRAGMATCLHLQIAWNLDPVRQPSSSSKPGGGCLLALVALSVVVASFFDTFITKAICSVHF